MKILILLLTLTASGYSQIEWAETGSKWNYSNYLSDSIATNYVSIYSIGDTIIDGIENSILEIHNLYNCTNVNKRIYTYMTSENQVMIKINDQEEHFLLYDFNKASAPALSNPPLFTEAYALSAFKSEPKAIAPSPIEVLVKKLRRSILRSNSCKSLLFDLKI